MRPVIRSAGVALLTIAAAVLLALSTTMTSVVLAATALIMGGTGHPLSVPPDTPAFISNYVAGANSNYVAPSGLCIGGSPGCTLLAVYTPEQFKFDTGFADMTFDQSVAAGRANLDNCIRGNACTVTPAPYTTTGSQTLSDTSYVVYGYSQSATVATMEKRSLVTQPVPGTSVGFILVANPNRPNGGILERFVGAYIPILGVTFSGATPTDTGMTTVDVARQYDGWADWPTNPLNLLADINAGFGIYYLHPNYIGVGTPLPQGQYGDTTYYLIPTPVLPMLMPLEQIPVIGPALAAMLDPFMRVLVEAGYNRTINPGQPTPANFLYFPNPVQTLVNLLMAIPTGLDNAISAFTGTRPFGTPVPGPYGVGGPPVDTGCGTPPCGTPTPYAPLNPSATRPTALAAATVSTPNPKPTNDAVIEMPPTITTPLKVAPVKTPSPSPFTIKPIESPSTQTQNPPTSGKPLGSGLPALNKLVPSLT
ncbi:MAG: PE-PPE domain-containing protein, partial [Mycobacteriaceae bacterium]|nr:PE-PPE domain-containing protein [Mycobacteriaceae bacterium]